MTLKQVIKAIEIVASRQPSVNMIVRNDIFRLNSVSDARYGVFGWTQGVHSADVKGGRVTYQFTFFYIDRLTEDKSNQVEIQSVGMETLGNIISTLDEQGVFVNADCTMQTFNQRFLDECAGVFCNVAFEVSMSGTCPEEFLDFNLDYNDDFTIF